MKKAIGMTVMAVVLFGVSAAASLLLKKDKRATNVPSAPHLELEESAWEKANPKQHASAAVAQDSDSVRVAIQPPYNQRAEEIVQLANSYHDRLASLQERESQLTVRQKQLELIYHDLRGEKTAIDQLRKQISEELNAAKQVQVDVEKSKTEIEDQRQKTAGEVKELEQRLIKVEGIENGNVQKMAEMLNNMAPDGAARILQQMADSGKIDTAVKLMGLMKASKAAKVLAEFTDPAAAAQLLDKLRDLKQAGSDGKK